ncbi:MAG: hypothetical protein ACJ741_08795, partial [Pyrinomonadaceae bacterium]
VAFCAQHCFITAKPLFVGSIPTAAFMESMSYEQLSSCSFSFVCGLCVSFYEASLATLKTPALDGDQARLA